MRYRVRHSREAGFLLIEAIVGVALVAIVGAAVLAAVVAVQRSAAAARARPALALIAANILTDIRAAAAYDVGRPNDVFPAGTDRRTAWDIAAPTPSGPPEPVHVVVWVHTNDDPPNASVAVSDAGGHAVTMETTLAAQAPAPGTVIPGDPTPGSTR